MNRRSFFFAPLAIFAPAPALPTNTWTRPGAARTVIVKVIGAGGGGGTPRWVSDAPPGSYPNSWRA
jgi:hypothetical protein